MNEIIEKRGRNSKTFDLGNGKYRLETGNHPHTLKNGLWLPVDTAVEAEVGTDADTSMTYIARSRFENLDYDIRFGKNDPVWMKIKHLPTNKIVVFKPRNNNNKPDHTITGNKIFVSQAWDGIDMEIFVSDKGTKTNYKITSPAGQRIVEFNASGDFGSFRVGSPWYFGETGIVVVPSSFSNGILAYDFRNVPVGTVVDPTVTVDAPVDTFFHEDAPTVNNVTSEYIIMGRETSGAKYRGAFAVDLSGVPAGQKIDSASLTMTYDFAIGSPVTTTLVARAALKATNMAQLTWNEASTGVAWATAGAGNVGVDTSSAYEQDDAFEMVNGTDAVIPITQFADAFYKGTLANNGLIITMPENEALVVRALAVIDSSQAAESVRPFITIEYSPAPSSFSPSFGAGKQYPFAKGRGWR